jgi:LysR family hydrogen peroxide-inducible transcriptional activator
MTLQQLEYVVAVDNYHHFVKASHSCFVTQATLSSMIKKLEDELQVKIFDRRKQPILPTTTGKKIIAQAKIVLQQANRIKEIITEEKGEVKGDLRIGIIPTLSPYLLPMFINNILKKYPQLKLRISELTTYEIVDKLEHHLLDVGLLATPLGKSYLTELPLFYEQFVVYASSSEKLMNKKYLLAKDIDINRLWLLEEGHCLRSQVINLCELKSREKELHQLDFEAGSIETLKKIVESNQGITILPELAIEGLTIKQKNNLRYFKSPAPAREISLVTYQYFTKSNLIEVLRKEILQNIPEEMKSVKKKEVIESQ